MTQLNVAIQIDSFVYKNKTKTIRNEVTELFSEETLLYKFIRLPSIILINTATSLDI